MRLQEEEGGYISTDIPRLNLTEKAFRCKTVKSWNKMSQSLRTENSLSRFKTCLRQKLIEERGWIDGWRMMSEHCFN